MAEETNNKSLGKSPLPSPNKKESHSLTKINSPSVTNGSSSTQNEKEQKPRKRKEGSSKEEKPKDQVVKKKRRRLKDAAAPKHPISGYFRFMNDHRDRIKAENPKANFTMITKILAAEWSKMGPADKQQYLEAAEQDKERYSKELEAYKQTDVYKMFAKKKKERKLANKNNPAAVEVVKPKIEVPKRPSKPAKSEISSTKETDSFTLDIPIFTEEFLDHNKARETELRQLRKSTIDYEQQNSILQTHLANMQSAVEKLEAEVMQQITNNAALKQHLEHLRNNLVTSLAHLPLPGSGEPPNLHTIDNYMLSVQQFSTSGHSESKVFLSSVKSALGGLHF
ncbi:high mobility group protein 20A-like [Neocloeon triangulifer]|uniref:high mobility group protein 20A-like n=1 Tax=Neocloeon triangulifer TaxID=2078957 RepID=UPI00286F369A|nr:high mobility group protein 20A-like [Neocloeon triangulifer]